MLNRKLSARIACIFLILHGAIEILGLALINSAPNTLISFGGLTGALLGTILSTVTIVAAISIVPADVADTFLAMPVLMLLSYTWYGNDVIDIKGV